LHLFAMVWRGKTGVNEVADMTQADIKKFMKFFGMLGADSANGEREVALRELHKITEGTGQSWNDITKRVFRKVTGIDAEDEPDDLYNLLDDALDKYAEAAKACNVWKEQCDKQQAAMNKLHSEIADRAKQIELLKADLTKAREPVGVAPKPEPKPVLLDDRIKAAIKKHPYAGDREIARMVECAPATVGKVRAKTGKPLAGRTVIRNGRAFKMKARTAPLARQAAE
jgi:hypothetical protein